MSQTATERAIEYTEQVLSGDIVSCIFVKQACQRFCDDLERDDLEYRIDEAERFVQFAETLPHVKGKLRGERQIMESWQCFIFCNVFGFYYKETGLRKYEEVYAEVTRKQGKSLMAADVGLFMLTADGQLSPEVYCGATSEIQADFVFKPAKQMCNMTPDLCEHFSIDVLAQSITTSVDDGLFQRVIGDPGDGGNPSCWVVDEYHEHKKDNLYQTGKTGVGARENPLVWVITTAGDNVAGPCYSQRETAVRILQKSLTDAASDSVFAIIFTIDKDDDWQTEEALAKANPNINVSVSGAWLRKQQLNAINNPKDRGHFKTKHLNMWINAVEAYIPYEEWLKCGSDMDIRDYEHLPCIMGIDLSSTIDITAELKVFYETIDKKTHYYWFPEFWIPEDRVYEQGAPDYYKEWVDEGHLRVCDGARITNQDVKDVILEDCETYKVPEIVFDPWRAIGYEQDLEVTGCEIVMFPQTIGMYTGPMDEMLACILDQTLHHTNNPVLNWMASNLEARRDTNGNVKPRKENPLKKIDGMCAGIMALGRVMAYVDDEIDFNDAVII